MKSLRAWAAATFIVFAMGVGVTVAVRNTRAIQAQRVQSILSDCRENDAKHISAMQFLHDQKGVPPYVMVLIAQVFPYNADCHAIANQKVK